MAVRSLSTSDVDTAFRLFRDAYEGTERDRFEADLADKQKVILLRDRDSGELRGFSSVRIENLDEPARATVIFSGDTVIHREYWGQKQLQTRFARILLAQKLRAPHRPLYWFLLSKGYRTYMLLANAFPKAIPRYDRPDDPRLRPLLDRLAAARFGTYYDTGSGIVRFAGVRERVREGLAPVRPHHLDNPHVRFFVERNPRHSEGDELACLAEVRLTDLARIAGRIGLARARLLRGPVRDVRPTRPASERRPAADVGR